MNPIGKAVSYLASGRLWPRPGSRWLRLGSQAASGAEPPPRGEVAWADTLFFGSVPLERWNPDELLSSHGATLYRRMMRDDQIRALLALKHAAITGRPWHFHVRDDSPEQQQCASFLRFQLEQNLSGTFGQAMGNLLTSQIFGFSVVEKVYDTLPWEGRTWWGLRHLKLRPAETFTFVTDAFGNLTGLMQNQGGRKVSLPPERFILHVNKPWVHPQYGESDLRECHRHWWAKENILKFWNMYLERMAAGFIHGRITGPLTAAEREELKQVMRNLNGRTSVITPGSVELQMVTAPDTDAFERAVAARDRAMAKALLVPNLLGFSEQGQVGSYSQSRTQLDAFFFVLGSLADSVADTLNEQLFRELARWNFGLADPPRFVFDPLTDDRKRELAQAWREAVSAGAVTQTPADERRTRELLGYPPAPNAPAGHDQEDAA